MMKKVLVFTPTYNEIENIEPWLDGVLDFSSSCDFLVVDDSSVDGTTEILTSLSEDSAHISVIIRNSKSGIGSAHLLALNEALNKGYELLITLDADLSHDPCDIPRFIEAAKHANYVVGTRSQGGSTELEGIRRMLSKGANLLCRVLLPTGLSEYTTAYRCYDREAMRVLTLEPPKDGGYSFFIEATEVLYKSKLKLSEIPIIFRNRVRGESKIPSVQVLISGVKILDLVIKRIFWHLSQNKG